MADSAEFRLQLAKDGAAWAKSVALGLQQLNKRALRDPEGLPNAASAAGLAGSAEKAKGRL